MTCILLLTSPPTYPPIPRKHALTYDMHPHPHLSAYLSTHSSLTAYPPSMVLKKTW